MRFSCSEFPNHNQDLHEGAIGWFTFEGWQEARPPTPAAAIVEVALAAMADDACDDSDVVEVEELHADEWRFEEAAPRFEEAAPRLEPILTSELPPPMDPFNVFVQTLADACIAADELVAAAEVPGLFLRERAPEGVEPHVLDEMRGWRAILRGESDDLAPCGAMSLDEWSATVLARLCHKAAKLPVLRREVRARGIAAFGLVDAAA